MRQPHSFARALAHRSLGALPRRVAPPPDPGVDRPEPAPAGAPDPVRAAHRRFGAVLLCVAALLAAWCAVPVLAGRGTPSGVVAVAAVLTAAGVLLRRPGAVQRILAVVVGVLLLPALLVIALAVRLSGPGPVLVREARPDPDGRSYRALRFRTTWRATASEARTTAVGRLLHSLSLDELPSLLDMALGRLPLLRTRWH